MAASEADNFYANSVEYAANSIEAVGARVRAAIAQPAHVQAGVLEWAKAELERIGDDCGDIAEEAKTA